MTHIRTPFIRRLGMSFTIHVVFEDCQQCEPVNVDDLEWTQDSRVKLAIVLIAMTLGYLVMC